MRPARREPVHRERLSRAKVRGTPRAAAGAVNKAGRARAPLEPSSGPRPVGAGPDPAAQAPAQAGPDSVGAGPSKPLAGSRRAAEGVSVATAAGLLGVSRRTVQCMLEDGRLKGWRLPPRGWWKISRESLAGLGT